MLAEFVYKFMRFQDVKININSVKFKKTFLQSDCRTNASFYNMQSRSSWFKSFFFHRDKNEFDDIQYYKVCIVR
jgi:hypothetical protein